MWDESFRVCYDQIDNEHKDIFKCIFDCAADRGNADKLAKLAKVTTDHFTAEEGMMQAANYSDFANHKPLHTKFLSDIGGLSTPLSDENIKFAKEWLVNHIMNTDFKYKGKL